MSDYPFPKLVREIHLPPPGSYEALTSIEWLLRQQGMTIVVISAGSYRAVRMTEFLSSLVFDAGDALAWRVEVWDDNIALAVCVEADLVGPENGSEEVADLISEAAKAEETIPADELEDHAKQRRELLAQANLYGWSLNRNWSPKRNLAAVIDLCSNEGGSADSVLGKQNEKLRADVGAALEDIARLEQEVAVLRAAIANPNSIHGRDVREALATESAVLLASAYSHLLNLDYGSEKRHAVRAAWDESLGRVLSGFRHSFPEAVALAEGAPVTRRPWQEPED